MLKRIVMMTAVAFLAAACEPEVGSKEWCEKMEKKEKGEWTLDETSDFAKHCMFK